MGQLYEFVGYDMIQLYFSSIKEFRVAEVT